MKAISKILAGAAGVAAIAGIASPASAQGYPYGGYGGYGQYGYGNQGGGVVGAILNSIINPYGRTGAYNYGGEQQQVELCVQAVNQRVSQIGYGGYGGYNQPYGGYNNGYNQPYGGYNQPYGGYNQPYGGYNNNGYGTAQVASVDRVERHSDGVKVRGTAWSNNRGAYTPYGGYNRNYGGYSGYNARGGDIAYSCRVTSRMQVRDINLYDRRTGRQIG